MKSSQDKSESSRNRACILPIELALNLAHSSHQQFYKPRSCDFTAEISQLLMVLSTVVFAF